VPATLIDLDTAPAAAPRPGHSSPRGRSALAALSLILLALLGPAAPGRLKATLIAARNQDDIFVHGERLYVVDAVPTGQPRPMRTYRLPDGKPLARTTLRIPDEVTGVLPVGDTTLIQTTIGERPAVVAMANATGLSPWWQFGSVRGASAAAGEVLISDDNEQEDFTAVDLRTGSFRWELLGPRGGLLTLAGERDGLPRWLVGLTGDGRLTSYDGRTGKSLASVRAAPFGALSGALAWPAGDDLFAVGGRPSGVTAYALPGLEPRWRIAPDRLPPLVDFEQGWLNADCGPVVCAFLPKLIALDPATGRTRWASDRWTVAGRAGDFLVAGDTDGEAPDSGPVTVLDPATGRVRADLGGWREIPGPDDGLTYLVHPGASTSLFGRFDPATISVRILGTTHQAFGRCDRGAGAVVCHLTAGPVAVWRLD
jgi:outer membrane protein assembly factor BamB